MAQGTDFWGQLVALARDNPVFAVALGLGVAVYAVGRLDPKVKDEPVTDEDLVEAVETIKNAKYPEGSAMDNLAKQIERLASQLEIDRKERIERESQTAIPAIPHQHIPSASLDGTSSAGSDSRADEPSSDGSSVNPVPSVQPGVD